MSLAAEHYRALLEEKHLPAKMNAEDAVKLLREVVTDTQQLTLSQLPNSTARQLGSILFSHEAGLMAAFTTLNPPKIKKQKEERRLGLNPILLVLGLLMSAAAFYLGWDREFYILSLFVGAAALLSGGAYFVPKNQPKPVLEQTINTDALFSLVQRRMEAIDRDLDAFLSIPTGDAGGDDDAVVKLITLAIKLKIEDPDCVPDELMTAITALSIARGYEFLDYGEETEQYFDTMPTKRDTRTIVPAVLKNGNVIARGMAIVKMEAEAEED